VLGAGVGILTAPVTLIGGAVVATTAGGTILYCHHTKKDRPKAKK
jgi:hypothetical protein